MRALLALVLLMLASGCTRFLAEQIVRAPNRNDPPIQRGDASAEELKKLYVDRQLRVPVGPPDATISVWVFNPFQGPEWFKIIGAGRQVHAQLHRGLATSLAEPKGTIFILHGIQDEKDLAPYVLYREQLVHLGYRVVQLDFRGH